MTQHTQHEPIEIHTVAQFAEKYPAFSQGSLRWMIFQRDSNGLADSGALLWTGRTVRIDALAFFRWLRAQQRPTDLRAKLGANKPKERIRVPGSDDAPIDNREAA